MGKSGDRAKIWVLTSSPILMHTNIWEQFKAEPVYLKGKTSFITCWTQTWRNALWHHELNMARDRVKSYFYWIGIPWPATGTMASEWSENSKLKPLTIDSIETTRKELYGEQVRLSGLSFNPLAQAHENNPPGIGRQICWQAFALLLQPLEDAPKWNQN